jgi:hypothetical protein
MSPNSEKRLGMGSRLTLDLLVCVDDRTIWDGHTGGSIRNPDFDEGRMLTELAPFLEREVDRLQTMLRLHADPFGWIESQGIVLASALAEATTDGEIATAASGGC